MSTLLSYLLPITLLFTPSYLVKFTVFGLPTNLLMVWVFFVWIVFGLLLFKQKQFHYFLKTVLSAKKKVLAAMGLFVLAGLLSVLAGGVSQQKIGQFLVLFAQPVSIFFIGTYVYNVHPEAKTKTLYAIYAVLAAMGLYALYQYLTLNGLPSQYWGNEQEPKRAISVFTHPNFYALFSAPLLALLIPDALESIKVKIINFKSLFWFLGALGLLLSQSRAGWIGLAAALLIYAVVAADKKTRLLVLTGLAAATIVIFTNTNWRYRVLLPFYGEKSAVSRLSLWHTGQKAITESPITGLGLTGFANNWQRLNTDPNIDSHNFPHNVFLNFWVETGLLGLVSFIGLIGILLRRGIRPLYKHSPIREKLLLLGTALFIITILTQGLLDNPYFKNDLAMVFWIAVSLGITASDN